MSITAIGTRSYQNKGELIIDWKPRYKYPHQALYDNNIGSGLDSQAAFNELFEWKNGRNLSKRKMGVVNGFWNKRHHLAQLKEAEPIDLDLFENYFKPKDSSCIWKIFLLHIAQPERMPIFDQHVFRAFHFIENNEVKEIPEKHAEKFKIYRNQYLPWFNKIINQHKFKCKEIDNALFAFGKMIKILNFNH